MPLLRKQPFKRLHPAKDLRPEEEVFFCEATKEVFRDYDDFFQRTILCNSLVWSCAITGKANLTYEEAVESERKAKKRLGAIPKPLKRGLLWLASKTKRGRLADLVDDVYVFSYNRYFKGEIVEGIVKEQWCDCKILRVIPPTEEEIAKDAAEEAAEEEEERKKKEAAGEKVDSPSKSKEKGKKAFSPPDHLFKYELQEVEPDDPANNEPVIIEAEDIRREKGTYTREKNLLYLKNIVELNKDNNFALKPEVLARLNADNITFGDVFAGPEPKFEESKRLKGFSSSSSMHNTAKRKLDDKKKGGSSSSKNKKVGKGQGTLDSWVKGGEGGKPAPKKNKKQTAAEIEAEMKRIKENNARFKEEMRQRAEDARKKKLEDKVKEKERKKEEAKLLKELMGEWKKRRDDLECDNLKEMPSPKPVHCKVPNKLFGEFLTLMEFVESFREMLEVEDNLSPKGLTFETLEEALTDSATTGGAMYDILSFFLGSLFDLQEEEDEEVKLDKLTAKVENIDKNILGKDEDIANQIKSATVMAQWPTKTQGQKLKDLHMDEWSITEILRLHLEAAGAFRSEKLIMWLYQQRGGYRLSDDPGLHFRMEEPQILDALKTKSVFELSANEKMKILNCLMYQILTFATMRDIVDERFNELSEAKMELRNYQIAENKRQKAMEEAEKQRRKEERMQKKEDELKTAENKEEEEKKKKEEAAAAASNPFGTDTAHLTERQRLAIQSQKEKEEKEKQKKEDIKRSEAESQVHTLAQKISEIQSTCGISFLGRDRAYRRFWVLETLPGLFVEHDDETVGPCLEQPTPYNPNSAPIDEDTAMEKVRQIMDSRYKAEEKGSSDKENDERKPDVNKTYSKKNPTNATAASAPGSNPASPALKQKVLATKNGTLEVTGSTATTVVNGVSETNSLTPKKEPGTSEEETKPVLASTSPNAWGSCLADPVNCPVHSTILPKTHWAYYSSVEELDQLIDSLNERGIREGELKDRLQSEREKIAKNLKKFNIHDKLNSDELKVKPEEEEDTKDEKPKSSINSIADLQLRDQILELEEKIFFGTLGTLKIKDRATWQKAIQDGGYDKQCEQLTWGGKTEPETPFESRIQSAGVSRDQSRAASPDGSKRDSTGSSSSQPDREHCQKVRGLASAILQMGQMLDEKYIKAPLGEDEKEKKKRLKEEEKRKKEREAAAEAAEEEGEGVVNDVPSKPKILTPVEAWENSLMSCTSYAQLYIHLTTLENSIIWSKSLLNTRCRLCRRKNDPDNMLLCDGCDRGHHTYCLKPKLKTIPTGDWYCNDCKPKQKVRSPKKKSRRVFQEEEEEVKQTASAAVEEEEETEEEEEENEETEDEGEEDNEDEDEGEEDEEEEDEDTPDVTEDEDDVPLKRSRKKRAVEPAPKKNKKDSAGGKAEKGAKKGGSSISMLFGKRRCAAEANERIARVAQESNSGNSSGNEEMPAPRGTRTSARQKTLTSSASTSSLKTSPKTNGGAADASCARSKRRRAVDDEIDQMFNPTVLEDFLNAMMKHKDGWPFDRPITKADAPDYHKIIKRPMDLGTIRSGIIRMKFNCNQEVLDDIGLVFTNCYTYNREDAEEYQCAVRLEKYFKKEAKKLGLLHEEAAEGKPSKKAKRTTM